MSPQQEATNPDPDAQLVVQVMDGFRASKAVFTAVSFGVFDRLHEAPTTAKDLAREIGCPTEPLERLLGACAGLGFLEIRQGRYQNLPAATRFLRLNSPETLSGYILYSDRVLYRLWEHLADAVKEGTNRWEQRYGGKENLFDRFFATDEEKQTFLAGMHGAGLLSSPAAVAAFDLSRFRHFVDLGGGTGHLVMEACNRNPQIRGTLLDLPAVTSVAARYIAQAGLENRVEIMQGDFFRDELPNADLYAVGRILHDWSDEKVAGLLAKIQRSLSPNGGLLICEKLLNEERDGPATAYLQSLNMLVCTEGRERTASEYERLTKSAGFRSFEFRRTRQPVDAMLALK